MKFSRLAVAAALVASSVSYAAPTCTNTFALGTMGPPATMTFEKTFSSASAFHHCYDFSINAAASASGTTTESDARFLWFVVRDIELLTVSLFNSFTGTQIGSTDHTTGAFSFSNLAASSYKLVVEGYATKGSGTASYSGTLTTSPTAVASPVPEAPLSAMLAMAMIGAGLVARRAKRS
jgi:hypothetical protein